MKHKENDCQAPFCNECWAIIKGNLTSIMSIAEELRKK